MVNSPTPFIYKLLQPADAGLDCLPNALVIELDYSLLGADAKPCSHLAISTLLLLPLLLLLPPV